MRLFCKQVHNLVLFSKDVMKRDIEETRRQPEAPGNDVNWGTLQSYIAPKEANRKL